MRDFINNIESYKIYNLIAVATIAFIIIVSDSFYYVSTELKHLSEQNRILIVKEIQQATNMWLFERITNVENSAQFIDDVYDDEQKLKNLAAILTNRSKGFDTTQLLIPGRYFYVNGEKMDDYTQHYTYGFGDEKYYYQNSDEEQWYLKLKWFTNTKANMKTTMETMDDHGLFHEKTINICTPIIKEGLFRGVYCGIIKASALLERIDKLDMPQGGYYFISDSLGNVLASYGNGSLGEDDIAKIFLDNPEGVQQLDDEKNIITVNKFQDFDWYIVVGINEDEIQESASVQSFFKHAIIMLILFVLFMLIVNGSYAFLYSRAAAKKKEYEQILAYNSRMSEVGELVSGINHQLRQPLNSLSLIISGTLGLLSKEVFNKKTVVGNLKLSQKSIVLMDKTIDIFRNFYRYNDAVSEFYLKEAVKSVLYVMHTNLSQSNITIEMDDSNIKELKIVSIENFIQQILLVLIQNAQDAIEPMNSLKDLEKRKIKIEFKHSGIYVSVYISDFGRGVREGSEKSIFSVLHKSQKKHGFGMGLFFAKKLANEKLMGDVMLLNNANPTTFCFVIKKDLKEKDV
ncbi:MAG: sensor histidine kinase [Campylobacteraceae bacterium]|nr:sensor histidine kinase [Campylobacteraceae bacterium]